MSAGHLAPILSRLHLRHLCRCRPFFGRRPLSSANEYTVKAPPPSSSAAAAPQSEVEARREAYRQLENLDFMTATKILFTTPPKRKKFGLDFHLVQLFFACLPSLAVYLVAQYARYEIRRMEAVMFTFSECSLAYMMSVVLVISVPIVAKLILKSNPSADFKLK